MDSARNVIKRISNPRFSNYMAFSMAWRALSISPYQPRQPVTVPAAPPATAAAAAAAAPAAAVASSDEVLLRGGLHPEVWQAPEPAGRHRGDIPRGRVAHHHRAGTLRHCSPRQLTRFEASFLE